MITDEEKLAALLEEGKPIDGGPGRHLIGGLTFARCLDASEISLLEKHLSVVMLSATAGHEPTVIRKP